MADKKETTATEEGSFAEPVIDVDDLTPKVITTDAATKAATKTFAVSATGNLFIASTLNGGEDSTVELTDSAREAFSQVSVFFAAMTKAIAEKGKSLYDYDAIDQVISQSGMFVKVSQMDYKLTTSKSGVELSKELVQTIMAGFSGNMAKVGESLTGMVSSMGAEGIKFSREKRKEEAKVASLIFVCEYLMGAISITPILVASELGKLKAVLKAGPCFKAQKSKLTYELTKFQYLFVPPKFMEEAVDINNAMDNPDFLELVADLASTIK